MNIGRIPPLGTRARPRARTLPRRVVLARPILGVRPFFGHGVLLHDMWTTRVLCAVWAEVNRLRTKSR
jgi:hypothetical protein